jgi:hypothetical protein
MAHLAHQISREFGSEILRSEWLGFGSFKNLLAELDLAGLEISTSIIPGYVYDPSIHQPPELEEPSDEFVEKHPDIAPLARKVRKLTQTPYLLPEHYAALLEEIADEINSAGYVLNMTSKRVRDRCIERELPIARSHVNFVLRGITFAGHTLTAQPQSPRELAKALLQNTVNLCDAAQIDLSEEEMRLLEKWFVGG